MWCNYFDLGLFTGGELKLMVDYFHRCKVKRFRCFGFEPHPGHYEELLKRDITNDWSHTLVRIYNLAIAETNERARLYLGKSPDMHSLYRNKHRVTGDFVEVQGVVLSDWIKEHVPTFKKDFNILKSNIEGAEWWLMNDLVENDLLKHFQLLMGRWNDPEKVPELADKLDTYYNLFPKKATDFKQGSMSPGFAGKDVYRFSCYHLNRNADIMGLIAHKLHRFKCM